MRTGDKCGPPIRSEAFQVREFRQAIRVSQLSKVQAEILQLRQTDLRTGGHAAVDDVRSQDADIDDFIARKGEAVKVGRKLQSRDIRKVQTMEIETSEGRHLRR